jgi:hypothetical protein
LPGEALALISRTQGGDDGTQRSPDPGNRSSDSIRAAHGANVDDRRDGACRAAIRFGVIASRYADTIADTDANVYALANTIVDAATGSNRDTDQYARPAYTPLA